MFQDVDDFFEREKNFLVEYHTKIKDATSKGDKMTRAHKSKDALLINGNKQNREMKGNQSQIQRNGNHEKQGMYLVWPEYQIFVPT